MRQNMWVLVFILTWFIARMNQTNNNFNKIIVTAVIVYDDDIDIHSSNDLVTWKKSL